jgi:hypothetical protein
VSGGNFIRRKGEMRGSEPGEISQPSPQTAEGAAAEDGGAPLDQERAKYAGSTCPLSSVRYSV